MGVLLVFAFLILFVYLFIYLYFLQPRSVSQFKIFYSYVLSIGHFGKYHDTLCLSPQILHKHCFQSKTMLMKNFGGQTKSIMVFSEVANVLEPDS